MPDTGNVQETLYVAFMASPDTRVKEWLGQYDMPLPRELRNSGSCNPDGVNEAAMQNMCHWKIG
jgi:hypothetical protein